MTNRITHIAKPLLPATLTTAALLSLGACASAKPSAAAPGTNITTAVGAPSTTLSPPSAAAQTSASNQNQNQNQNQPQNAQATTTKPAAKPSTAKTSKPATGSGLPADCTVTHLKATVTSLTRPINHVLLTVTNTGSVTCSLYYYPDLRLDADQQAVTPAVEDSKPQAVVSIAPGGSAYAAIGTSAADGSGGVAKIEKTMQVYLESRDQSGSLQGSLNLPLPAGTYVDEKAFVTYWQSDLQNAVAW
jgi:hypothetical protein